MYAGSPRQLVLTKDLQVLLSRLKEISGCSLFFKLYSHRRLLNMQHLIKENEVIGRYDSVAGLMAREVIPPLETVPRFICCVGDDEAMNTRDGVQILPARPKLALASFIEIIDCQLFVPRRDAMEIRLVEAMASSFPADKRSELKILSRTLRYGLHNGHTAVAPHAEFVSVALKEDPGDREILSTELVNKLRLDGYVPDSNMAVTLLVEYLVGVETVKNDRQDPRDLLQSSQSGAIKPLTASVCLGCGLYLPSDGQVLYLRNVKQTTQEDGLNIELPLMQDAAAVSLLSTIPLVPFTNGDANKSQAIGDRSSVGASFVAQEKKFRVSASLDLKAAKNADSKDDKTGAATATAEQPQQLTELGATFGFDIRIVHPVEGELKHEQDISSLKQLSSDGGAGAGIATTGTLGRLDGEKTERDDGRRFPRDEKGVFDDIDDQAGNRRHSRRPVAKPAQVAISRERPTSSRFGRSDRDQYDDEPSDGEGEGQGYAGRGVQESIVGGDNKHNRLMIDPFFYNSQHGQGKQPHSSGRGREDDRDSEDGGEEDFFPKTKEIQLRSNLAAAIMNSRFVPRRADLASAPAYSYGQPQHHQSMIAAAGPSAFTGDPAFAFNQVHRARSTMVPAMGNDFFMRGLSRGAKSRLHRYGIQDTIEDSPYAAVNANANNLIHNQPTMMAMDLELEAGDDLSLHEINIQFGGFRASGKDGSKGFMPRAIYFSFQFFTCEATRTEDLRLILADGDRDREKDKQDGGAMAVLMRDLDERRQEAGLVLRYLVDCSRSSPFEAIEFAEYLAHKSLYIDVWDADSLLPIGTMGIPLRMLMRQNKPMVKHALECDVINCEVAAPSYGGVTAMTVMEGGPVVGELLGAVQLVIANYGSKGHGSSHPHARPSMPIEGLNWRAHGSDISGHGRHPSAAIMTPIRPKNSVRAKPLSSAAPELSRALDDVRHHSGNGGQPFRSLGGGRDGHGGGVSALNYDEVVTIFKQFAGAKKGTVQYAGKLMTLMNLPSMAVLTKKLTKIFKMHSDALAFKAAVLRYANSSEELTAANLEEFLADVSKRTKIDIKEEERRLFAAKLLKNSHITEESSRTVPAADVVKLITEETDRQDWATVRKRLFQCAQKAEMEGHDVEQMLCDHDPDGNHRISAFKLRDFLQQLSSFGKLTAVDIQLTIRMFSRHKDGKSDVDVNTINEPIALPEFLAAIGRTYIGNLQARVKKMMQSQAADSGPLEAKYVLRLLNDGKENSAVNTVTAGKYSYDQVEGTLRSLGVYSDLSAAQVRSILHKLDPKGTGAISASSLLTYLGIPFNKSDLPSSSSFSAAAAGDSGGKGKASSQQQVVNAEDLLRLLMEKAQAHGLQVDAIFRHFDANGDGSIGGKELEQGLDQLELFNGIPGWKQQLPAIIKQFDTSGDGLVSLKEFFKFLGIKEDYAPNIVQRLTKIFAIATDKGLSFKTIFEELDADKNNTLDASELMSGLQKMGSFEGVSREDVAAVIKIFDSDNSGVVSLNEFVAFFTLRVEEDKKIRRVKNAHKIAQRFREVMRAAQGKGASVADIFRHLDKDGGGSVSTAELGVSLSKLPHLKSLKREDIDILLAEIDSNGSGDVTLDEFEAFVNDGQPAPASGGPGMDMIQLVKETFGAAIAKGLKIDEEFRLLDRDRSGRISLTEFEQIIRKMPSFKSSPIAEIKRVFNAIDVDNSGLISPEEFTRFVAQGKKDYEADVSSRRAVDEQEHKAAKGPIVEERSEERFIRKITAIAAGVEGSLSQFLAYLDDDGDGLILPARLLGTLRREGMFDREKEALYVSEEEVMRILDPFMTRAMVDRDRDNHRYQESKSSTATEIRELIKVIPFLQYLESRTLLPKRLIELDYDTKEDHGSSDHAAFSYNYSADPAVNAVEKKLNHFGRILARKGVDVEQLFLEHDPAQSGHVMRTDFVKVLGSLGMYLLEEGKVLREGNSDSHGNNKADQLRRLQLQQVRRVASQGHGSHTGYSSQAPNLARRMFRQGPNDHHGSIIGGAGEFKSHLESMVIIDWYRQGQKQALLQQVLSHSLAHTVHLFARFGTTLFFEYPLTNPFGHEERFEVELPVDVISGQELRLVTSFDEWTMLRRTVRPCVGQLGPQPAEMDMFDLAPTSDDNSGNNNRGRGRVVGVTLLPHETVFLPFTFLSLQPFKHRQTHSAKATGGSNTRSRGAGGSRGDEGKGRYDDLDDESSRREGKADDYLEAEEKGDEDGIQAGAIDRMVNTIAVRVLSCSHGHVISILRVVVHPRPFIIHRVIRCYEFEHAVAKRHVKLLGNRHSHEYNNSGNGEQRFFVHCVETYNDHDTSHSRGEQQQQSSRVAVEWGDRLMSAHPELQQSHDEEGGGGGAMTIVEMMLRYRCGPAPSSGSFFLLLYKDPYQSKLHEVTSLILLLLLYYHV